MAIRIEEIELSQPIQAINNLNSYHEIWLLVKLHGFPIGDVREQVLLNNLDSDKIIEMIVKWLGWQIITHLLEDNLLEQKDDLNINPNNQLLNDTTAVSFLDVLNQLKQTWIKGVKTPGGTPPCVRWRHSKATPKVTVAIPTRNGATRIEGCLNAIDKLDYPDFEIVVIDNAPESDAIKKILDKRGDSRYRYIVEDKPGVSWARNCAIKEARGEIIAFTDDDARPDPYWLLSLVTALQKPGISLVTGCGYPLELNNEVQEYCERYRVQDRGFERRAYEKSQPDVRKYPFNSHTYGGGYNMAAWREELVSIGGFDPSLGRGSLSGSGCAADLLNRFLDKGHTISYEPTAIVRLLHPSDYTYVIKHEYLEASGLFAFLTKNFLNERNKRKEVIRYGLKAFYSYFVKLYLKEMFSKNRTIRRVRLANLIGAINGPGNYFRSLEQVRKMTSETQFKNGRFQAFDNL